MLCAAEGIPSNLSIKRYERTVTGARISQRVRRAWARELRRRTRVKKQPRRAVSELHDLKGLL